MDVRRRGEREMEVIGNTAADDGIDGATLRSPQKVDAAVSVAEVELASAGSDFSADGFWVQVSGDRERKIRVDSGRTGVGRKVVI